MIAVENKLNLEKLKVLVITHSYATGLPQEFVAFLKDKVHLCVFIDHPFSFANEKRSSATLCQSGQIERKILAPKISGPDIFYYFKDFFFTIFFALRLGQRFDFCMAADNLNTLSALFLQNIGIVEKVIYHTVDYTPRRFRNNILNTIYHLIDKICCYNADFIWNSSPLMVREREKKGVRTQKAAEQIVVPDGNNFDRIERLSITEINRYDVVFMGHLRESTGVAMLIEAFSEICLSVDKAGLVIIGTGPLEDFLKQRVAELGISDKVSFAGYIEDYTKLEEMMAGCAVAVAPYVPDPGSFSFYSDVNKPKAYMACGLPVVITPVPQIAYEIKKKKAGLLVNYNKREISEAIVELLTNDRLYQEMRTNAIKLASNYTWEKILTEALSETLGELELHKH